MPVAPPISTSTATMPPRIFAFSFPPCFLTGGLPGALGCAVDEVEVMVVVVVALTGGVKVISAGSEPPTFVARAVA